MNAKVSKINESIGVTGFFAEKFTGWEEPYS